MWLTAAGWKTRGKFWRFKWSFAMTTGVWCMLINRWGGKYACCWWREKKGKKKCEWQKLVRQRSPRYQKVTKFASPHKSPNRMWYMLQKVWFERLCIWYKGKEIGTILHMLWQHVRVFFFWQGEEGQALSLWHLQWIPGKFLCLCLFHPSKDTGHRMLNLHHKSPGTASASKGIADNQTGTSD